MGSKEEKIGRYLEFLRQEVEKAELNEKQYEVQDKIQEVKTMLEDKDWIDTPENKDEEIKNIIEDMII